MKYFYKNLFPIKFNYIEKNDSFYDEEITGNLSLDLEMQIENIIIKNSIFLQVSLQ